MFTFAIVMLVISSLTYKQVTFQNKVTSMIKKGFTKEEVGTEEHLEAIEQMFD